MRGGGVSVPWRGWVFQGNARVMEVPGGGWLFQGDRSSWGMSVPGGWEFQEDGSQAAEDCFTTVCRSFSIYHQGIYLPWRKIENLLKTVINNLQLPDHVGCIWVFRAGGGMSVPGG